MPRRGENIYKRKDGRWEGRYIKGYNGGKALYGYLYGKSYGEVKIRMIDAASRIKENNTDITFLFVADEWLNNTKLRVKESTYSQYKNVVENHLKKHFGNISLNDVTSDTVDRYVGYLIYEGYSSKTVNDILTIIKSIFKFAKAKGFSFECDLCYLSVKTGKREIKTLSKDEQIKLTCYLTEHMNYRNFGILLSLYTGIRIGELCALKWGDVDMKERTLKISKTMIRIHNYSPENTSSSKTKVVVTSPKSNDSIREIPIPEFIFNIIESICGNRDDYILTGKSARFIEPRTLQYHFKSIIKECGIEDINFHALRHTFATRCVENGFDIKSLSEILGHSNVKITLDRYVHSSIELKRINMQKLTLLLPDSRQNLTLSHSFCR